MKTKIAVLAALATLAASPWSRHTGPTAGCQAAQLDVADLAYDSRRRVHDFANLLSDDQRSALETRLQTLERQSTAQVAVVTVRSLDGNTVDEFANQLFNRWGIGQKDRNNGVLLLVAPNERRARIEVGYGLEPLLTDDVCGAIVAETMIPEFRRGDFPAGILAGTARIEAELSAHPEQAKGLLGSGARLVRWTRTQALGAVAAAAVAAVVLVILAWLIGRRRVYGTVWFFLAAVGASTLLALAVWWTWLTPARERPWAWLSAAAAAIGGALWTNLRRYRRFGPHGCSKCGARLQLLSEKEDNEKLSAQQQLEEQIGAVDYDVWYCPACLNSEREAYINYFSKFRPCPSCRNRTYYEGPQVVLRAATTSRTGRAQVEGQCVSCKQKQVRTIVLPMIQVTSSSFSGSGSSSSGFSGGSSGGGSSGGGGSSFGGGSSGGGGASGGW